MLTADLFLYCWTRRSQSVDDSSKISFLSLKMLENYLLYRKEQKRRKQLEGFTLILKKDLSWLK